MPLSATDMEALIRAQEDVGRVGQILHAHIRDASPASVVGALLTVQLQHCDSIILLLMTGQNKASAEALIRPAVECFVRLMWVCEDEQRALAVTTNTLRFPSISILLHRLFRKNSETGIDDALKHLHGLTHAGMEQLMQHFSGRRPIPPETMGVKLAAFLCFVLASTAGMRFCLFTKRTQESVELARMFESSFSPRYVRLGLAVVEEITKSAQKP
jgi:hypothetical protein